MRNFRLLIWLLILALPACGLANPDQATDLDQSPPATSNPTLTLSPTPITRQNPLTSPEIPSPTASSTLSPSPASSTTSPGSSYPYLSPGVSPTLIDVAMITDNAGWALSISDQAVSHILHTQDGGLSWQEVSPSLLPAGLEPEKSIPVAHFLDPEHAWVIFTPNEPYPPHPLTVLSTSDGGNSWQTSQPLEPEADMEGFTPRFFQFVDPTTGWLMIAHGAAAGSAPVSLYQTIDGGRTWEQVQPPLGPDSGTINVCCQSGMHFSTPEEGLITSYAGPISEARVNWTNDGGRTWRSQTLPPPPRLVAPYCSTLSPQAPQPGSWFILVECLLEGQADPASYLYFSSDRGQNWLIDPLPSTPTRTGEWQESNREGQIYFPTLEGGWFTIQDTQFDVNGVPDNSRSFIYQTRDSGKSWQLLSQTAWSADFSFLESNYVWAAAHKGTSSALVFSPTGGQVWQIIETKISPREEQ